MPDTSTSTADFTSLGVFATVEQNTPFASTNVGDASDPAVGLDVLNIDWGSPVIGDVTPDNVDTGVAIQQIEQAAQRLGGLPGTAGGFAKVPGGWVQFYDGCDIYYGPNTGAHEVHGDIRAKYNFLQAASGILGLPTTDETVTPDGIGRYNHFQNGSIYWTPRTGPMLVRGPIRNIWANSGWELGPLGYPVADEYRLAPLHPADHPKVAWSIFENGAIAENAVAVDRAHAVDITPDVLRRLLRKFIDDEVHKSGDNIGLQPQVETLQVSEWSYGFWAATPRTITFRLHGFHDNGLLPDTDFELDMRLRFGLAWQNSFTYPAFKTLIAALEHVTVTAHGLYSGSVADGVRKGVEKAFYRGGPDPVHAEVPDGAVFITGFQTFVDQTGDGNINIIDIQTTRFGGLQILVPAGPIVPGGAYNGRQLLAQNVVNDFIRDVLGDGD